MYFLCKCIIKYSNPETRKLTSSNEQVWIWNFRKYFFIWMLWNWFKRTYCVKKKKKEWWKKKLCMFGNNHFKYICMKIDTVQYNENIAQFNVDSICGWQLEIKVNKFVVQWPHLVNINRSWWFLQAFWAETGKCQ